MLSNFSSLVGDICEVYALPCTFTAAADSRLPIRVQDRTSRSKFQMLRLVMPSVFLLVGGAGLLKRVAPRRLVPSSLQLVSAITTIEGWVAEYIGSAYQLAVISVVYIFKCLASDQATHKTRPLGNTGVQESPVMFLDTTLAALCAYLVLHYHEPSGITDGLLVILPALVGAILFAGPLTLWSCVTTTASYFFVLVLSVVLYRLSPFHPLAHFPGPVLNKATKLAGVWTTWTGHQHLTNQELHVKYGPFVRVGPNDLSIVDVDAVISVLGPTGMPKGRYYNARRDPNAPSNLIILQGEPHAHRRRLWNRGLTPESLHEYEAVIAKRASQVIAHFQETSSGDIDLVKWINYFTFDVMGDMAFGRGFNMILDGDKDGLWETIEQWALSAALISHMPWAIRWFERIPLVSKNLIKLRKFGLECAMQRMKAGATTKDLWYHLSDEAGIEREKPSVKEVASDGALAVIAGADTTASAVASLFWFLLQNPNIYKQLQEEIDTVYADHSDPLSTAKHSKLVYLNACINEALRLHPPVPTNGPRQVPEGAKARVVAGRVIPEGTQIYVPPYSLHRDPRYFSPSPNAFIPERWLDSDKTMESAAFIPFSFGPANCVGRQMAKQEMLMFASVLLQNFTFSFVDGFDAEAWPAQLHDYFVTTRGPLMVRAKPRSV